MSNPENQPRRGGARPGAGRPRKIADAVAVVTAPTSHGGARPGSGRPRKDADAPKTAIQSASRSFAEERAIHERVKREQREHALAIARGEYVQRDAVRRASATMLAALAQALRSLPDNLERKLNLSGEVAQEVGRVIDDALDDAATTLARACPEARSDA